MSKLKVGSKTTTLRKRLKGERRYRVGKNTWYVAKGKKARILFRARKSKVLELALADYSLTSDQDVHRAPAARVGQARQDQVEVQEALTPAL